VLVTDFGLVRLDEREATVRTPPQPIPSPAPADPAGDAADSQPLSRRLTQVGAVLGTPAFMAPEQFDGQADARSDQFAFCVSLYWALYRQLPFARREGPTLPPVRDPPPGSRVPRWLRATLLRGMSERPEARYPSMQALLDVLGRDPDRIRRRWLAAVGISGLVVAAAFGVLRERGQRSLVCAGAASGLVGAWDPARKAAVGRTFRASGLPFADDAFARTSAKLDAYAAAWAKMRTSACEATRLRGEQSEELLDLRMECLDQRARELSALTELFMTADARLVARSVDAVQGLTPLGGCADASSLKAPVRMPSDPSVQAAIKAVKTKVAHGQALLSAARYAEGLAWMKPLVDEARATHHAPTEALALDYLARMQVKLGDYAAGEATLKKMLIAAERGRDDEVATRACIGLTQTLSLRPGRLADAAAWAEHAAAWLDRAPTGSDVLRMTLERALGNIGEQEGKLDEARTHFENELALARKVFKSDDDTIAIATAELAYTEFELGHVDESLRLFREALPIMEKAAGPRHPNVGNLLNNLGLVLTAAGSPEAIPVLERARAIFEAAFPPTHPAVVEAKVNLEAAYKKCRPSRR
jgi:tetratricopeptide (TPR) repeat protein